MPVRPSSVRRSRLLPIAASLLTAFVAVAPVRAMWEPIDSFAAAPGEPTGHLVVSELLTGATSASDEFVELFNPSADPLPLEGLEVVYVTASGATVTRKAAWGAGAASIPPGAHLLVANEAGAYAAIADVTYASGLAATGGSVALRIQGASTAIDAVGWGTATSTWLEGTVAPAPVVGSSLERLPGGAGGSFQDTDDNRVDFVVRDVPDPQNSSAAVIDGPIPSASATPTPVATASATPEPPAPTPSASPLPSPTGTPAPTSTPVTPSPSPSATPQPVISIADARLLADGAMVSIRGSSLSESAFTDGGGYLADETGGIAVLLSDGAFVRGRDISVSGVLDTRYEQRTLRASAVELIDLGSAVEPDPLQVTTGGVGEGVEANLVAIAGEIVSSATTLSGGVAFDVDDGSGAIRVLVMTSTGIDTSGWQRGGSVTVIGVVGQRDASGTGTSGYRVQPRDAADVQLSPPPTPTPTATPTASPTAIATPTPAPSVSPTETPAPTDGTDGTLVSIADARAAPTGARVRIRGVVTVGNRLVDPPTAVVQDTSAAIVLRLGDEAGSLARGQLVEVAGTRSTKSGMLTIRVTDPPVQLGTQAEPDAVRGTTASFGEELEARLVVTRGAMTGKPRRSSAGSVSFGIDDGSGEVRVVIFPSSGIDIGDAATGTWIDVRGALGQDTTGSQPLRGYRIWPRSGADFTVLGEPPAGAATGGGQPNPPGQGRPRGVDPGGVRLTTLDRASAAGGPSSPTADRDSRAPKLGSRGAGTDGGVGSGALATPAAAPGAQSDRRPALAVLGLALAALASLAFVGWRDGSFSRLAALVRTRMASESQGVPDPEPVREPALGDVTQALPRLSVLRIPNDSSGP